MIRKLFALALAASLGGLSGCSMCCDPFGCDYGAYGGCIERADMRCGRVGSRFEPAEVAYYGDSGYEQALPEGEWEELPTPEPQEARRPGR
jgi:hypothetical protein